MEGKVCLWGRRWTKDKRDTREPLPGILRCTSLLGQKGLGSTECLEEVCCCIDRCCFDFGTESKTTDKNSTDFDSTDFDSMKTDTESKKTDKTTDRWQMWNRKDTHPPDSMLGLLSKFYRFVTHSD